MVRDSPTLCEKLNFRFSKIIPDRGFNILIQLQQPFFAVSFILLTLFWPLPPLAAGCELWLSAPLGSYIGMVRYGMVWDGMVWYGMIWYGMVCYGMELYGTV